MISAEYYKPIFLYTVIFITILSSLKLSSKNYNSIQRGDNNGIPAMIISAIYAVFLGMRPISSRYFCDTANYAENFYFYATGQIVYTGDRGDWIFDKLTSICAQTMDVSSYFTIIAVGYFGFTLWACKRFCSNNVLVAMLFMMGSLSFYTYCTNGIRNGLACSAVLLFLSFLSGSIKNKIIAVFIAFIAIGIHKTTSLPILMAIVSVFFIRNFRYAYIFWLIAIPVSLSAGGAITSLFAAIGFDDRLSYLITQQQEGMFSHTGFRWDFLIYSAMPIVLGYYIIIKKGIRDKTYEFLLNTYTLSNAFWILVITANFSNRFAYLSWFMYPLVLVYPLLKLNIWGESQGKESSKIMMCHIGFTWFMTTFYW